MRSVNSGDSSSSVRRMCYHALSAVEIEGISSWPDERTGRTYSAPLLMSAFIMLFACVATRDGGGGTAVAAAAAAATTLHSAIRLDVMKRNQALRGINQQQQHHHHPPPPARAAAAAGGAISRLGRAKSRALCVAALAAACKSSRNVTAAASGLLKRRVNRRRAGPLLAAAQQVRSLVDRRSARQGFVGEVYSCRAPGTGRQEAGSEGEGKGDLPGHNLK